MKVVGSYYKKKGAASGKLARAVAPVVKAIVRRQEEHKFAGTTLENAVSHNASITSGDLVPILPLISNGTGYNQRVGDKIRPTSLVVDGCVSFNDYGEGFVGTPLSVLILCLQAKRIRDPTLIPSQIPINILLDNGQGNTSWDGSTLNSMYPINKDEFEVLGAVRIKLTDTSAENTKGMSARYSMKLKTPAVLNFAPGSSSVSNFAPFFCLGWSRDDGTTPTALQTWVINTATARLHYTDA